MQFRTYLDRALCEQFLTGIRSSDIKKKLLTTAKDDSRFSDLLRLAELEEMTAKEASQLSSLTDTCSQPVNKVQQHPTPKLQEPSNHGSAKCYHCGSPEHLVDKCRHKGMTCHYCKKVGHLEQACRLKQRNRACNHIKSDDTTESGESDLVVPIFCVHDIANKSSRETYSPYMCEAGINSNTVRMEIDTGSAVSILKEADFCEMGGEVDQLTKTTIHMQSFSGKIIECLGEVKVDLSINAIQNPPS